MSESHSFAPIADPGARVLVLGSMPGRASLAAAQYYAHPRNAFWPILSAWCGIDPASAYTVRSAALLQARIALWDVLASCQRVGSLDSAIDLAAAQANDIAGFLVAHPGISRICFNGEMAARLYRRYRLPLAGLELHALPSTSPAHAGMPFSEKLRRWHQALAIGPATKVE